VAYGLEGVRLAGLGGRVGLEAGLAGAESKEDSGEGEHTNHILI
jgi:hypothetical protein